MTLLWLFSACVLLFIAAVGIYGSLEITRIPHLAVPYTPQDFGWEFEPVTFTSFDGLRLAGWFIPADQPSNVTIVVQHGLGSNAGDMILNTACLRNRGRWNLFYFNFRGHDGSEGHRTSLGPLELEDMTSALRFLKEKYPAQTERLAIYGHSMGAAVAIVGAARFPELEAVAAESPFSYISKTVTHFSWVFYGIPYFPFVPLALFFTSLRLRRRIGDFAPARAIAHLSPRPVFLIHAERDLRMPLADLEALWEAAREPKERWVVPGADHGEPWIVAQEEYERRLVGFFETVFTAAKPPTRKEAS
jgi:fermentation-respiration switch protein FrsA (DUF1100 family)